MKDLSNQLYTKYLLKTTTGTGEVMITPQATNSTHSSASKQKRCEAEAKFCIVLLVTKSKILLLKRKDNSAQREYQFTSFNHLISNDNGDVIT